jgi:hypothetical protein
MKQWMFALAAAMVCLSAAGAPACADLHDAPALDRCLESELDQKSRLAEQLARRKADARPSAERRQLMDDFAEWRKSALLACSIASQDQADALIREIQRKNCLIARTGERIYEDSRPLP